MRSVTGLIRNSKNILLFLSSNTVSSRALREEIDYGINDQGLPVIVIYPEYESKGSLLINGTLKQSVKNLWDKLPIFRDSMTSLLVFSCAFRTSFNIRSCNLSPAVKLSFLRIVSSKLSLGFIFPPRH